MDAKSAQVFASDILKYQTWFLKVPIHCEGCRRKVKKVLQRIDGVFTTTIDQQQQKVTVTGSVGVDTLIGKLIKAGKHAEIWPENATGNGKSSGKAKKKKNEQKDESKNKELVEESAANCDTKSKTNDAKISANNTTANPTPAADHHGGQSGGAARKNSGGGGSGKKKKKKSGGGGGGGTNGKSSSACTPAPAHTESHSTPGQVNLSPTRQQSYPNPETETYYYPHPMVYVATYNRSCPIGGPSSYYVPSSPYTHAGLDQESYQMQSAPLVSFEIFSDENANGCSIM